MKTIGITGGIGSGKTTCCRIFEMLNVPVYYADDRAKKLMTSNKKLKASIKQLLGDEAYFKNGRLNRKYISAQIFHDKSKLEGINQLVHPAVSYDVLQWSQALDSHYGLYESAILVENQSYKNLHKLIVVACPEEIRIDRVMHRDKTEREKVEARIKNQLAESEKIKVADYVIHNDGKQRIIPQIVKIHREIIGR